MAAAEEEELREPPMVAEVEIEAEAEAGWQG